MLRWLRRTVYELGFRPQFGTILYSPSLDFQYTAPDLSLALKKGFEKTMGHSYSEEDYERDKTQLESLFAKNNLSMGIIIMTNVHHVPAKDIPKTPEEWTNWFKENPTVVKPNEPYFFCPLCGVGLTLSIDTMLYECTNLEKNHGYFDVVTGRNADGDLEIIIKTIQTRG